MRHIETGLMMIIVIILFSIIMPAKYKQGYTDGYQARINYEQGQ
jgi:hypothetical protein